jgi:hypothetical protein
MSPIELYFTNLTEWQKVVLQLNLFNYSYMFINIDNLLKHKGHQNNMTQVHNYTCKLTY